MDNADAIGVQGTTGNANVIYAGAGDDALYGGSGKDVFSGDDGAASLCGGEDTLDLTRWGRALTNIIHDPTNAENGTVEFFCGCDWRGDRPHDAGAV